MKKVSYLTVSVMTLGLFVLGCGQGAPTASSANEVVPKTDAPAVSSEVEVAPQLVGAGPFGNGCCPEGFDLQIEFGAPEDRNGDKNVCRKVTTGGAITIDNNVTGDCADCVPPACP